MWSQDASLLRSGAVAGADGGGVGGTVGGTVGGAVGAVGGGAGTCCIRERRTLLLAFGDKDGRRRELFCKLLGAHIERRAEKVVFTATERWRQRDLTHGRLTLQVKGARLATQDTILRDQTDRNVLKVRHSVPLNGRCGKERCANLSLVRRVVEGCGQ